MGGSKVTIFASSLISLLLPLHFYQFYVAVFLSVIYKAVAKVRTSCTAFVLSCWVPSRYSLYSQLQPWPYTFSATLAGKATAAVSFSWELSLGGGWAGNGDRRKAREDRIHLQSLTGIMKGVYGQVYSQLYFPEFRADHFLVGTDTL